MKALIRDTFQKGDGILHMLPNFVPVKFGVPGRRLKLHPDDYYAYGMASGAITERWFCMVGGARKKNPNRPDQGMSYVLAEDGSRFLFKDAVEELKEELIGDELQRDYGTFPVFSKFFDYDTPLYFHFHPAESIAKKVGCFAKPECYYFPPQLNNHSGRRPTTYFGFNRGVTKEDVRMCIENFEQFDTRITDMSRAYTIAPGQGWYVPAGVIHGPGSLLTYEPQWATDLNCVLENVVCGETFDKQYMTDIVPWGTGDVTDYILNAIDWEANFEDDFKEKYYRPAVTLPGVQEGLIEKWICYGNPYVGAKEVTVLPGQAVILKDKAAYGCVIVQGFGQFGNYHGEAVQMMRVGDMTFDEFFVSRNRAGRGVEIRNDSRTEPMVLLQHFGPDHGYCNS